VYYVHVGTGRGVRGENDLCIFVAVSSIVWTFDVVHVAPRVVYFLHGLVTDAISKRIISSNDIILWPMITLRAWCTRMTYGGDTKKRPINSIKQHILTVRKLLARAQSVMQKTFPHRSNTVAAGNGWTVKLLIVVFDNIVSTIESYICQRKTFRKTKKTQVYPSKIWSDSVGCVFFSRSAFA
jgi:hypothetical protein